MKRQLTKWLTREQEAAMWRLFAKQPMETRERLLEYARMCLLHDLEESERQQLLRECNRCNVIKFTPIKFGDAKDSIIAHLERGDHAS